MGAVDRTVASLPGVQQAVHDRARAVQLTAKALAVGHGGLAGDIHIRRANKYDYDVVLEHKAALSIEVGHWDEVFHSGWVEGLHILSRAALLNK
jgi:hypothetical protein